MRGRLLHITPVLLIGGLAFGAAGRPPYVLPIAALLATSVVALALPARSRRASTTSPRPPSLAAPNRALLILALAFCAWVSLTLFPLPRWMTGPNRQGGWERYDQRGAQVVQVSEAYGEDVAVPRPPARLTLYAPGTIRFLFLLSLATALFAMGASASDRGARNMLWFLLVLGGIVAAVGIVGRQVIPQGKNLWWLFPVPHGKSMGPFANKNHFASFCAMLAPLALTAAATALPVRQASLPALDRNSRSSARATVVAGAVVFLLLTAGVVLSMSRGGFLAYAAGLAVSGTLLVLHHPRVAGVAAAMILLALFTVLLWPSDTIQHRIGTLREARQTESGRDRLQCWRNSLQLWADFPLTGCGMEAFHTVYPRYKTNDTRKTFYFAENEYVQTLTDGGLIGIAFALGLLGLIGRGFLRLRGGGGRGLLPPVAVAGLGTLAAALAHAGVDFALRIPLNAALLALLLGLALRRPQHSQGSARGSKHPKSTPVDPSTCHNRSTNLLPLRPFPLRAAFGIVFTVLVLMTFWTARIGQPVQRVQRYRQATMQSLLRTLAVAPTDWFGW